MTKIQIDWKEFVEKYRSHNIEPQINRDKIYELFLGSLSTPLNWKVAILFIYWMSILIFPITVVLFFFIKWWIVLVIFLDLWILIAVIRKISFKAVVNISLENPVFYSQAIHFETMQIYSIDGEDQYGYPFTVKPFKKLLS